ncbi:MAG TPA: hypothetical protein VNM22_22215 [Candidatus Limnocylindrales bacterium]|nr:hypothetical protein [Candidatus Limnocylindrales bacterium]
MAEETHSEGKPKKTRIRSTKRETRESEPGKGRPVPSDKISEHLRLARKGMEILSGISYRETREKEKSDLRPHASGPTSIQKPGEVEKIEADLPTREGRTKTDSPGLRPPGSRKGMVQAPGEIEREVGLPSLREVRIKEQVTRPGQVRPLPSLPFGIRKPGEIIRGKDLPLKRPIRVKEIEKIRPLPTGEELIRKPGEIPKSSWATSSAISEPTVERIEPGYILKNSQGEKKGQIKFLAWTALFLGILNLILVMGIYGLRTFVPEPAFNRLEATQTELIKEVGDMKYKSSLRNVADTLFKARVLIEVNKDYKEAAKELEKVKMGLNSLEADLPEQKRREVKELQRQVEAALIEVQKGPTPLQEKLTDISTRLNAL